MLTLLARIKNPAMRVPAKPSEETIRHEDSSTVVSYTAHVGTILLNAGRHLQAALHAVLLDKASD